MTTAAPDVTVWPFTDLDVEVPCDILRNGHTRCTDPAAWHATFTATCCSDRVMVLLCTDHKDYLISGAVWYCPAAGRNYYPADVNVEAL